MEVDLLERGVRSCPAGLEIESITECQEACDTLHIPLSSNLFKEGKPCWKGTGNLCNQNGGFGRNARLICKKSGNLIRLYFIILNTFILRLSFRGVSWLQKDDLIFRRYRKTMAGPHQQTQLCPCRKRSTVLFFWFCDYGKKSVYGGLLRARYYIQSKRWKPVLQNWQRTL